MCVTFSTQLLPCFETTTVPWVLLLSEADYKILPVQLAVIQSSGVSVFLLSHRLRHEIGLTTKMSHWHMIRD